MSRDDLGNFFRYAANRNNLHPHIQTEENIEMIKGLIYIPVKWVEFVSNYELNHTNPSCEKRERQMDGLIKES